MATAIFKSRRCFDSDAGGAAQLFVRERSDGGARWPRRQAARGLMRPRSTVLALAVLAFWRCPEVGGAAPPQDTPALSTGAQQARASSSALHGPADQDPFTHHVEEHMASRRNTERQRTLVADTDKLLELAQALKADVDKSNKDTLSIDVVKRAEQIEKLARSVKEKMRGN